MKKAKSSSKYHQKQVINFFSVLSIIVQNAHIKTALTSVCDEIKII